jgi:hypothetical protein
MATQVQAALNNTQKNFSASALNPLKSSAEAFNSKMLLAMTGPEQTAADRGVESNGGGGYSVVSKATHTKTGEKCSDLAGQLEDDFRSSNARGKIENLAEKLDHFRAGCPEEALGSAKWFADQIDKRKNDDRFSSIIEKVKPLGATFQRWGQENFSKFSDKASALASWLKTREAGQIGWIAAGIGALVVAASVPSPYAKGAAGLLGVVALSFGMTPNEFVAGVRKATQG